VKLAVVLAFVISAVVSTAQPKSSVVIQPRVMAPGEFIAADSSDFDARTGIPGQVRAPSTDEQDSAYRQAMQLQLSASTRFTIALREASALLRVLSTTKRPSTIWDQINETMNIPASVLAPKPQELTQYQLTIANAMYVPGVLLFPMGTGNMQVSFSHIAKVFGLGEDVSPDIRYVVDEQVYVEIVIYSAQAMIVSTIYSGVQPPGVYTVTWNGTSQDGHTVTDGEYIAEVRLGTQRVMRKRITWKSQ